MTQPIISLRDLRAAAGPGRAGDLFDLIAWAGAAVCHAHAEVDAAVQVQKGSAPLDRNSWFTIRVLSQEALAPMDRQ